MGRPRTGSIIKIDGALYARVTYHDSAGKRRSKYRKALSRTHAREKIKEIIKELDERGEASIEHSRMSFAQLAKHYKERYCVPAKYIEDRKVAGLRSHVETKRIVKILEKHFGSKQLRSITHGDILQFKAERVDTKVEFKEAPSRQRSATTINRELATLRRMLNIAFREGWILRHPFSGSDTLISTSDEKKRQRILSREEETLLLDACDENRAHLKPIIICALDTGMRRGEILSLRWADVDLKTKRITIRAMNTKTLRSRSVGMTRRLRKELIKLPNRDPRTRVFGITDTIKRSWAKANQIAEIKDLRFHDLRHTCATRLVQAGMPLAEVGRVLGHTNIATTFRYANADDSTLDRAVRILERIA